MNTPTVQEMNEIAKIKRVFDEFRKMRILLESVRSPDVKAMIDRVHGRKPTRSSLKRVSPR
jgi:division protein CdvB (Snf7/Vps24/ESCRT-III family)